MPRLIDAEALAEKVYRAWDLWEKKGNDCFVFSDIITPMLISMPTVDAVPTEFHDKCMEIEIEKRFELELKEKHGHWIERDDGEIYYQCSSCGLHAYGVTLEILEGNYNYCPNCGAKMDESKEQSKGETKEREEDANN